MPHQCDMGVRRKTGQLNNNIPEKQTVNIGTEYCVKRVFNNGFGYESHRVCLAVSNGVSLRSASVIVTLCLHNRVGVSMYGEFVLVTAGVCSHLQ